MLIVIPSGPGKLNKRQKDCIKSVVGSVEVVHRNYYPKGFGVIGHYQSGWKIAIENNNHTIAYFHNDVRVDEQWGPRVTQEFADPSVGVVGFGGALQHGSSDIYKTPYRLQQLGRSYYLSNVDDAEVHGERFTGSCDVAVLDGFSLIVRRSLLDRTGGWPVDHFSFHCYDYWVCCMAHRLGYKVRLVGVRCHHYGGLSSTTQEYQKWRNQQGTSDSGDHDKGHRYIYEEFRDVLPWSERY